MTPRRAAVLLIALLSAALPACSARRAASDADPVASIAPSSDFPAASKLLSGFQIDPDDDRIEHPSWRWGDHVLLGLRFTQGNPEGVRYLSVSLGGPLAGQTIETDQGSIVLGEPVPTWAEMTSTLRFGQGAGRTERTLRLDTRMIPAWVRLYDHNGVLLTHDIVDFPELFLGIGVYDSEAFAAARKAEGRHFAARPLTDTEHLLQLGLWALDYFAGSVGENPVLAGLAESIVRRPPWWRIMFNPTYSIEVLDHEYAVADPWSPAPGQTRDAYSVPLLLKIAGEPALYATLTVVPPDPPLGLCAGIVHVLARRPGETETCLEATLLAAALGDREGPPRGDPPRR